MVSLVVWCLVAIPIAIGAGSSATESWNLQLPGAAGRIQQRDDIQCDATPTPIPKPVESLSSPVGKVTLPTITPPSSVETVKSFTSEMRVLPNGSLEVAETIDYNFGSSPRHGIYRDLILTRHCNDEWNQVYPISNISVRSNTAPDQYEEIWAGGNLQLKIGSPDETITGSHVYEIRYRLDGVLEEFGDSVELYWNTTGDKWQVPLFNVANPVRTTTSPTQTACWTGRFGSTTPCTETKAEGDTTTFSQSVLGAGEGLTVAVELPAGSVSATPSYYQKPWSLRRAFTFSGFTIGGGVGALLILLGAVAVLGFAIGRDRRLAGSPVDVAFAPVGATGAPVPLFDAGGSPVEFAPPENIRPAQLAMLRNEEVRNVDVSATLIDLAVRGRIRIEERGSDHHLTLLDPPDEGWLRYETTLIRAIFPGLTTERDLSELEDSFASKLATVKEEIQQDAVDRGWFAQRPSSVRARWRLIGIALTLLTGTILAFAVIYSELALLALAPFIASLVLLFSSSRFPRRDPVGYGLYLRAKGFERFMTDSEAPRARWAEQRNIFSEYLPYAIVLGQAKKWAKTFEPLGAEAMAAGTGWYIGHDFSDPVRFVDSTSNFSNAAGSTLSSVPASTSSGSSGFSGGGGSSGGGGGGGGGGSW